MINFAILSRIKARKLQAEPEVVLEKKKVDLGKIAMKDPDTDEVVKVFESIDEAIAEGFSKPNLVGAIKKGSKYKGHLWTTIE